MAVVSRAKIQQINVSRGGVPKLPIARGTVTPLGLEGDSHSHPQIHGGPRKAVLIVTAEGIEELKEAGFPLYAGALGENLTIEGLDRRRVRVGERYRVGEVVIEIVKVRQPCQTLDVYGKGLQKAVYDADVKAGNPSSERWGLSGFYCSVVTPGTVRPGDPVVLLDQAV
jgi:MOSC domain-containing protein YiiM